MSGLLAGTGCGGDDVAAPKPVVARSTTTGRTGAAAASSTSTTAAPGSTTTLAAATTSPLADGTELAEGDPLRAEIETAYRNAVQAFIDAAAIPDPNFPALAQWTTGAMFDGWKNDLTAMQIQGRVGRYPPDSRFEIRVEGVRMRSDGSAVIETCDRDDGRLIEAATGAVVNGRVTERRKQSIVQHEGDGWRISDRSDLGDEAGALCFG